MCISITTVVIIVILRVRDMLQALLSFAGCLFQRCNEIQCSQVTYNMLAAKMIMIILAAKMIIIIIVLAEGDQQDAQSSLLLRICIHVYMCMCVYIYIYTYSYTHMYNSYIHLFGSPPPK